MESRLNLDFNEIKRIIVNAKEGKLTEQDLNYLDKLGNLISYIEYMSKDNIRQ